MPTLIRDGAARAPVYAAVAGVIWLAMFVEGAGPVDQDLLKALYSGGGPVLAEAARLVTLLGGGYFVTGATALAAIVLVRRKQHWPATVLFAGNLAGRLLVEFQKYELNRLRPDANPHLVHVYTLSFPSGHSANAVMTYVAMAVLLVRDRRGRRLWVGAAIVLALLVGLSRVMLGVHWPSDVIAGWSFGALWVLVMLWFAERGAPAARAKGRAK